MHLNYLASIGFYIPEIIVSITMMGLLFLESTYPEGQKKKPMLYGAAYIGLALAFGVLVASFGEAPQRIFTNAVTIDPFSSIIKMIMVIGATVAIYLSQSSDEIYSYVKAEFSILVMGVLVGGMVLASANNMLIFYVGLEILSILSYTMASMKKDDERSSEAGLKYVLYGALSSGIMLFGMSHIFGVLGTIHFTEMISLLANLEPSKIYVLMPAFLLFFVGIGYKIGCVPFHMWSPDVYEGSPLPVTAFFSVVPKMAGLAALVRVSMTFFSVEGTLQHSWVAVLMVIGALTMTVGNVSAIGQKSVKRMLAYSSISHAGLMVLAVVVLNEVGTRALLFYGVTYLFMTLVAFTILSTIQNHYKNDHFERFSGLVLRYPVMAIAMAIVMFSLAGIPPFSGFVAKFNILAALIQKKYYVLAIVAGINSVVAVYYYLKIVRLMVFKPAEGQEEISGFTMTNQTIVILLCIPVVLLGLFWSKLLHLVDGAKIFIQ